MAKYGLFTLTNAGQAVLTKALIGKKLEFLRVEVGDGQTTANKKTLTRLVNKKNNLDIQSVGVEGNNPSYAKFRAMLVNTEITTGYYVREIGVIVKEPDTGAEVLYGYVNSAEESDFMPPHENSGNVEFLFNLEVYISEVNNIIFPETTSALYVTYPEFYTAVTRIDADISAEIAARKAGDNDLLEKINNEKIACENGDADLLRKINAEIQDRENAITTEKTEREDALENHRLSSNPHPNLTFDGINGSLATSRLSGLITNDQIQSVTRSKLTGSVAGSLISGALTGATIGAGNVTGTINDSQINSLSGSKITRTLTNAFIDSANITGLSNADIEIS